MDKFWQDVGEWVEPLIRPVLGAVAVLVVGLLILRYLIPYLRRLLERGHMEQSIVSFLTNSVRGVLLVVIVIGILQQLGVATTSLLTVLATAGLAVALSLQNTLSNFTAGLLLLSFRMLRVGDVVETGTMRGRVAEIFPFHVVLVADDNQVVSVPNSLLIANGFRNHTTLPTHRAQWSLTVRSSDDLTMAKAMLQGRLLADPRIHREPPPRVFVQEWSEDKRTLTVQAWASARDTQGVQEDMLEPLGLALASLRLPEKT